MQETNSSSDQLGAKVSVRQWRVLLWDHQPHRRARIRRLVSALGARAIEIFDVRSAMFSSACCVAAVATGSEPDGAGMGAIRDLKRQGFEIVAYEDGTESWSIKLRCFSLLAGAGQLLDSSAANFDCRIQDALAELLSVEAKNQGEAQQITSMMRDMGMVGSSAAMMSVFRSVIRFSALSDLPVLIVGETGTGKRRSRALSPPARPETKRRAVYCSQLWRDCGIPGGERIFRTPSRRVYRRRP